jgi:hypothetical protein
VRSNVRDPIVAILALLGTFLSGSSARAEDYSVEFGVDSDTGRDAGTLTCQFDETCAAKMESLGLHVSFYLSRRDSDRVSVHLEDYNNISCCFFAGAADSIRIDPHQALSRVSFFKGVRARGALLIENERVGTLYLRFHSR